MYPKALESATGEGESPVGGTLSGRVGILSTTGHEKPGGKQGGPPSKAKEQVRPIEDKYREGKVKSTPRGG